MKALLRSKYGYVWVTLLFFSLSLIGHWIFGWFAYVQEQEDHQAVAQTGAFVIEMLRDTFENWQSEFLQLMWQVAGLAYLLYLGSPQSKEGSERLEEKIDALLYSVEPKEAETIVSHLDKKYPRQ